MKMWFKINVFKHKLAHLNISSWCCLWAFHQRQQKRRRKQPIKNLSIWNDENLQSRNRTQIFFYHFLNQTKVIKKLQTSFKQPPQKKLFLNQTKILKHLQTIFKGPKNIIPFPKSNWITMKIWKQVLTTNFKKKTHLCNQTKLYFFFEWNQ